MEQTKSMFASKTIWGGIIIVLAAVAGLLGYSIAPDDQAAIASYIDNMVMTVGGLLVIWGRITATKKIG